MKNTHVRFLSLRLVPISKRNRAFYDRIQQEKVRRLVASAPNHRRACSPSRTSKCFLPSCCQSSKRLYKVLHFLFVFIFPPYDIYFFSRVSLVFFFFWECFISSSCCKLSGTFYLYRGKSLPFSSLVVSGRACWEGGVCVMSRMPFGRKIVLPHALAV